MLHMVEWEDNIGVEDNDMLHKLECEDTIGAECDCEEGMEAVERGEGMAALRKDTDIPMDNKDSRPWFSQVLRTESKRFFENH